MKKSVLKTSLIILLFSFGCEKSLSSEAVISDVKENGSLVKTYHALIDLSISVTNHESGEVIQESTSKSDIVINEQNLNLMAL